MDAIVNDTIAYFYYSLIGAGYLTIAFASLYQNYNSLVGTIIGYLFMLLGFSMMVSILLSNIIKKNPFTIVTLLFNGGPYLLIISIICYILYLLIHNFKKISENRISSAYNTFTHIILILFLMQLLLLYLGSRSIVFQITSKLSKLITLCIYLLGLLLVISVISLGNILTYFSADG